jgi:hypothetical protein
VFILEGTRALKLLSKLSENPKNPETVIKKKKTRGNGKKLFELTGIVSEKALPRFTSRISIPF